MRMPSGKSLSGASGVAVIATLTVAAFGLMGVPVIREKYSGSREQPRAVRLPWVPENPNSMSRIVVNRQNKPTMTRRKVKRGKNGMQR